MTLYPMKLVTIICEAILEEGVIELLLETGAHGHTASNVRGSGHQGARSADIAESGNIQIEVIVQPAVAEAALSRLHAELFASYAMVAYASDVGVLRPEKF